MLWQFDEDNHKQGILVCPMHQTPLSQYVADLLAKLSDAFNVKYQGGLMRIAIRYIKEGTWGFEQI